MRCAICPIQDSCIPPHCLDTKAEAWAVLQAGAAPTLAPEQARALAALAADLPRRQQEAAERGARLLLPGDDGVDALLAPLPYPVALWVRGTLPPPAGAGPRIALVGSREASTRGQARTRAWARALTAAGVAVPSGLARGIDGAAHAGALEAGPTWGFMGSGLDPLYPPEHTAVGALRQRYSMASWSPRPGSSPAPWSPPASPWTWARSSGSAPAPLKILPPRAPTHC